MPKPLYRLPPLLLVALCSAPLAQTSRASRPNVDREQQARKLVTLLELPSRQVEAMVGLKEIGAPALKPLLRVLKDPRPEVVVAGIRALDAIGKAAQPALPRLAQLAAGDDARVALAAFHARPGIMFDGMTVVAHHTGGQILELRPGQPMRTIGGLKHILDAELLATGNYLVCDDATRAVREITRDGKEVWAFREVKAPVDADRLPNGNTLIADAEGGSVIEVDAKGKVVWQYSKDIKPRNAERLGNGNTLITDLITHGVLEVDRAGKTVWHFVRPGYAAFDAERLPNGNTLITMNFRGLAVEGAHTGLIREVDPKGKTVMEIKDLYLPGDADRLWNGHTLVADRDAILEFDVNGKEVWRHKLGGFAVSVQRY